MPASVFGLPTHMLVLHAVVVLVPLTALGATLLAVAPRLRPCLTWPTLVLLTAALVSVPVATASGNTLLAELAASGALGGPALEKTLLHRELGEQVLAPTAVLWALTVALAALTSPRLFPVLTRAPALTGTGSGPPAPGPGTGTGAHRSPAAAGGARRPAPPRALVTAVAVLAVLAAGAATVQTVRAGHAGSTAVWNPGG